MSFTCFTPARLAALALVAVAARPRGASAHVPDRLLGGRFEAVVAVAGGAVALSDGAAVFLDAGGRVRRRCGGAAPDPMLPGPRARAEVEDTEDILRAAGLPDDDPDTPAAEDALEDEAIVRPRRPRGDADPPPPEHPTARALAVAGGGASVWIAGSDGLWHANANGSRCARRALAGREVVLVAAAGEQVAAVAGGVLWRGRESDDGPFEVATTLQSAPRALAITDDGAHVLVATDDGVLDVGLEETARVLDRAVNAIAACGPQAMMLAAEGVYAWSPEGGTARVGPRPPARTLGCAMFAAGRKMTWAAAGVGLWTSGDGATWTEEPAALGFSVGAAALSEIGWWLATDDGLWLARVPAGSGPTPGEGLQADRGSAGAWMAAFASRSARAPDAWAPLLPRVGVALGGRSEAGGRAEWHLWVLVTFSLGRTPRHAAAAVALRAELAARRGALAAEARRSWNAPPDDGEAAARARLADDEQAALP